MSRASLALAALTACSTLDPLDDSPVPAECDVETVDQVADDRYLQVLDNPYASSTGVDTDTYSVRMRVRETGTISDDLNCRATDQNGNEFDVGVTGTGSERLLSSDSLTLQQIQNSNFSLQFECADLAECVSTPFVDCRGQIDCYRDEETVKFTVTGEDLEIYSD